MVTKDWAYHRLHQPTTKVVPKVMLRNIMAKTLASVTQFTLIESRARYRVAYRYMAIAIFCGKRSAAGIEPTT